MDTIDYDKAILLTRLQSSLYRDYPALPLVKELRELDLPSLWPFRDSSPGLAAMEAALRQGRLEELHEKLRDDFMKLFIGIGMPLAPLWGSVYLDEENLLMGDSCRQTEEFMARSGLAFQLNDREPLDHLGLLLSALAHYLGRAAVNKDWAETREFLQEFILPWSPRCLELVGREAREPFYRALGAITGNFLDSLATFCKARRKIRPLYF